MHNGGWFESSNVNIYVNGAIKITNGYVPASTTHSWSFTVTWTDTSISGLPDTASVKVVWWEGDQLVSSTESTSVPVGGIAYVTFEI